MQHQEWETWRAVNGSNIRVTYHSEWSKMRPWVIYVNGTAGQHFATIEDAQNYVSDRYRTRLKKDEHKD